MLGIAGGAFLSGLLVQYGPDPLTLIFWILAAVFVIALAVMPTVPDVSVRTPGWLGSLRPRVGIPPGARSLFAQLTPSLIAAWAMSGLYLSLGPSLVLSLLHSSNHFAGGLVIVAFAGGAAIGSLLVRALDTRLTVIIGSVVLTLGVGVSLLAIMMASAAGSYAAAALTGLGFGPAFSGSFRSFAPLAPPDKRSSLLSSVFVVSYLAFGVVVLVAGVAITSYGLFDTTYGYGLVVMAFAALTTIEAYRSHGRTRTAVQPSREPNQVVLIPPLKS
jgi:MFS family permease